MIGQFNEEKVNKYFYRLRKAFVQNNKEKSQEYLSHLKYHVMVGGVDKTIDQQIGEKLVKISDLITNINTETSSKLVDFKKQIEDFKKQIADKENELVQLKENLQTNSNALENAIGDKDKLSAALNEAFKQINLAQTSAKTSEDAFNAQIQELQKKLLESDARIAETSKSIGDTATEMATKDNEISDLKKRVEDLTASNESEKKAKDAEIAKLTILSTNISEILKVLDENMKVATAQVASLEKTNKDLVDKVAESASKILELEQQISSQTADKDEAIKLKQQAEAEKQQAEATSKERLKQLDGVIDQLKGVLNFYSGHPNTDVVQGMVNDYNKMEDGQAKQALKIKLEQFLNSYTDEKKNMTDPNFGDKIIPELKKAIGNP